MPVSKRKTHSIECVFLFLTFIITCLVLPLQGVGGVYYKLDVPPLSLAGFSPTTQIGAILCMNIRRSRGRQSALA